MRGRASRSRAGAGRGVASAAFLNSPARAQRPLSPELPPSPGPESRLTSAQTRVPMLTPESAGGGALPWRCPRDGQRTSCSRWGGAGRLGAGEDLEATCFGTVFGKGSSPGPSALRPSVPRACVCRRKSPNLLTPRAWFLPFRKESQAQSSHDVLGALPHICRPFSSSDRAGDSVLTGLGLPQFTILPSCLLACKLACA